jgi:hypothetical protein
MCDVNLDKSDTKRTADGLCCSLTIFSALHFANTDVCVTHTHTHNSLYYRIKSCYIRNVLRRAGSMLRDDYLCLHRRWPVEQMFVS